MTQLDTRQDPPVRDDETQKSGHGHWAMIACCIPMLVIAVVLVATGVAGFGFIVAAIMCTAMMAMMMRSMSGAGGGGHDH
jgi:hypothetical protein